MGPLTGKQQQLVQTLEVIRIEQWIPRCFRVPGRPRKDRAALARAFVAKAVYDMPTTRVLLDRLVTDVALRRICGWERKSEVPSESVFSRAFVEFSDTQLPQRTHAALIRTTHHDRLVGHLCRDSTAIEAREKPAAKGKTPPLPKRKRGRPKKGEERPKVLKRLDRQAAMTLPAMLDDLPTDCDVGMKKDSKGYKSTEVAPVSWTPILLGGEGVSAMPKTRPPYAAEFRQQMVDLVRSGRAPEDLAREFEPSSQAIRTWVAQAGRDAGERSDGLRTEEREELRRLRRENRRLCEEREILAKATAWFAREARPGRPTGS